MNWNDYNKSLELSKLTEVNVVLAVKQNVHAPYEEYYALVLHVKRLTDGDIERYYLIARMDKKVPILSLVDEWIGTCFYYNHNIQLDTVLKYFHEWK